MAKQIDKSTLGYLGVDFQYKLVKYFVEDGNFFNEIVSIVDQNSFTEPLLRMFVGNLKDYYQREGSVPSYEMLSIILRQKANSEIELAEWDELIKKLKETSYEGYTIIKDSAIKFFKQQRLIQAANKILAKAGTGDTEQYEECKKILEDALNVDSEEDLGHSIFDYEDQALSDDYTISIPTGIDKLDEALGGGLDKGKLGLLMAALGVGKTTYSTAIAAYASTYKCQMNNEEGWRVLQIYFEDDNVDITRKHFSRITKTEASIIRKCNPAEKADIKEILHNYSDRDMMDKNLRILKLKTGEVNASGIKKRILKMINSGFKPDMVVIDYFECLTPEKGGFATDTTWDREGRTMRFLENMATELNIALWITTQGGRDSIVTELLTADKGSGSIKKQQIAQVIVSVTRDLDGQNQNAATLALLKNRSGRSGAVWHNVIYDNGTSTISCSEAQTYDNMLAWKEDEEKLIEQNITNKKQALVREIKAANK